MATIPFREYLTQTENALGAEHYDRVIAFCQHALRAYPKCVDFYRMLGQACVHTGRPEDAKDMFSRVLSADPQNFFARVALGEIAEGISAYDEAIWQWERALEIEPNQSALREGLQKQIAARADNPAIERIKPTRAALGYIYMRGEQYERAAAEFRALLSALSQNGQREDDRPDLQVALAESLYRAGHQREAADVCQQVLKILPNALKPTLILGSIYYEAGREDEARALFERAQKLDPENRLAAQLLNQPLPMVSGEAVVEEPSSDFLKATEAPPRPSFTKPEESLPWLKPPEAPVAGEAVAEAEPLPEWLEALRAVPPPQPAAPARAEHVTTPEVEEPDWLKALRGSTAPPPQAVQPPEAKRAEHAETIEVPDEELPEWLVGLRAPPVQAEKPAVTAEPEGAEELPAWLQAAPSEPGAPIAETPQAIGEAPPVTETGAEEIPDWLKALGATTAATAMPEIVESAPPAAPISETPTVTAKPEETVPDWLKALQATAAAPVAPEIVEPEPAIEPPPPSPFGRGAGGEGAEPPRAPREAVAYFDDSAAPPPIEAQIAPTGEAEQQARLELARAMKDVDLDEALALYEQMSDATEELRLQAIGDLTPLVDLNPRVQAVIEKLGGVIEAVSQPPEMPPAEHAAPVRAEHEPVVAAPPPPSPFGRGAGGEGAEPPHAPREAVVYFDDSAAPPSIETQAAPTGEAEYQARLDLARMLVDLDIEEALDQYMLMAGASPALLQQAVDDVEGLTRTRAEVARTYIVLEHLRAQTPGVAPVPAAEPVVEPTAELPQMVTAEHVVEAPREPIVAEEAMEAPSAGIAVEPEAPALPVVDETLAAVAPHTPREATAYFDDSTAPPSIETQAVPTGAAEYRARLDLARALKFMDVEAALNYYAQLEHAGDDVRQQAVKDLEGLALKHPRARQLLDQWTHIGAEAQAQPQIPEWLAEAQSTVTLQEPMAPVEPVVEEETMTPGASSEIEAEQVALPIVDEEIISEPQLRAPREAVAYFDDSAAPPSIETQATPTGEAEDQARLALARTLRGIGVGESLAQYKSLVEDNTPILSEVIDDLKAILQEHSAERAARILLADALTRAGRLPEAIEQYRLMV